MDVIFTTVDTLDLVLSDDSVLKSSTVLKKEDGVTVTAFILSRAFNPSPERLQAAIECTRNLHRLREGLGAGRCGNGERCALSQREEVHWG